VGDPQSFSDLARGHRPSLPVEIWAFLRTTKKYWLIPIFVIVAGMIALALLSSSAAAPFIYSLF
jgi:hypothetical protein